MSHKMMENKIKESVDILSVMCDNDMQHRQKARVFHVGVDTSRQATLPRTWFRGTRNIGEITTRD